MKAFPDCLHCFIGGDAGEKRNYIKQDHGFIWCKRQVLDLVCEVYGVMDVAWSIPHQRGQDSGEMLGDVICHRVNAAYNGSEWSSFLVYLREAINAYLILAFI